MEALRTLINGHLPPAGEPVRGEVTTSTSHPEFPGYDTQWVDSGTSALALALIAARRMRADVTAPEVIVPGYCCPDLVAAAHYAGIKAVAVDTAENDAGYDLQALEECVNERTVAVIAVNFLGVKERLSEIVQRLKPGIALIEDNAQWFPDDSEQRDLEGDFIIFSFGRGKPVSLLGGGLLLFKKKHREMVPVADEPKPESVALTKLKHGAYNWLLRPQLYQLLNRNPLIKLGETRYHPLERVLRMESYRAQLVPANVHAYRARSRATELAYDEFLDGHNQLHALNSTRRRRLLRYPLLLTSNQERDDLLAQLCRAGLGATAMYQRPLVQIPGMDDLVEAPHPCRNAQNFASRLLTLPVHSGVTENHLKRTRALTGR
ncbi:DegT/DnrJ/EryC1/StrS family aminotransferase [Marinimicrobium sp. ABcell2]|uniref:DegT/DnrJ/EryC1/StrS family aminotransferase n=1 Tax=Marinimicrobium sp. ABcell2 TaxID=3069751 RepID=UPI0027B5F046|nr:DegT/DnrJ/EryC1/StrS family aminotransferase [Marinimicrobium sp. ABcell2]MDQ2076185.1 DegT/DnrJ/EryC1/StrS family aminotransferase [Marinimicrobium sp. ABcell2]